MSRRGLVSPTSLTMSDAEAQSGSNSSRQRRSSQSSNQIPSGRSYVSFGGVSFNSKEEDDAQQLMQAALSIRDGSLLLGSLALSGDKTNSSNGGSGRQIRRRKASRNTTVNFGQREASSSRAGNVDAPSGISQLLSRNNSPNTSPIESNAYGTESQSTTPRPSSPIKMKVAEPPSEPQSLSSSSESSRATDRNASQTTLTIAETHDTGNVALNERTPLIKGDGYAEEIPTKDSGSRTRRLIQSVRTKTRDVNVREGLQAPLRYIPATILGILLNLLDGVSYGLITFPATPIFADYGGIGVSMFFVSTIISQLVTSSRSVFKGANGSMMIEIVPFIHNILFQITADVGEDKPHRVVATTMVAIALSSILTGLVFFLLGKLKMGILLEFFPRHILVGCIGGIGMFLFITGIQVTARMDENDAFRLNLETFEHLFNRQTAPLWTIPLALSLLLRIMTARWHHPLIIPAFFLVTGLFFYLFAIPILHRSMADLRNAGWLFALGDVKAPWYEYFTKFDFADTDYSAVLRTLPTQFALVFFAMLHVPLNVPALALSVGEDNFKADNELVNHGLSNFISGLFGSVPNYLVYTNSVLFYRVGGTTRLAGFMLALASAVVMMIGPQIISFLPVMVVGALIYLLGIDLLKEALWDTIGRVSKFEYVTIWAILITMTAIDFVVGIGVGIVVACIHFVVSSSQRTAVRRVLSGSAARSTVRRHPLQSQFLRKVGSQIRVIKLAGFVFFGTASRCEASIRQLLETGEWHNKPLRFLILDFTLVQGVDFSAAEAFLRILRLCTTRDVVLVLCGCREPVANALKAVDLWMSRQDAQIIVYSDLNTALEHSENTLLNSLWVSNLAPPAISEQPVPLVGLALTPGLMVPGKELPEDIATSPRRSHLISVAKDTMGFGQVAQDEVKSEPDQPLSLFISALTPYATNIKNPRDFFHRITQYFTRMDVKENTLLWKETDDASSFYVIESGVLRATTEMVELGHSFVETMLPASVCGVLSFLAETSRTTRLIAERDAVLWRMDWESYERLEKELAIEDSRQLRKIWMRVVEMQQELVLGHLVTSL